MTCSFGDGIAWVRLDLGAIGGHVDERAARTLCDLSEELELDDRVSVVVLSGSAGAFCTGVSHGPWQRHHDWVEGVARLTRPVVAVVNGDAVAEGCELALACDLRISADRAGFCLPQVARGDFPCHGGIQRLARLVGRMRAMEILLSGRRVTAAEAQRIGLVTFTAPRTRLEKKAREYVTALARRAPIALRLAKEAVVKGADLPFEQGIRLEQDLYALLQTTADRREGIDSFLSGRPPRFQGK